MIHTTDTFNKTDSPQTERLSFNTSVLCHAKPDAPVRVVCKGSGNSIAEFNSATFTLNELNAKKFMFNGVKGGQIVFSDFEQVTLPSFLDYLRSGW